MSELQENTPTHGEQLASISRGIVRMLRDQVGRGPTKCKTHFAGDDLLVVVLNGGFLDAERTLHAAGREGAVTDMRNALQSVLEPAMRQMVEENLGREVISFMSANSSEPELMVELFALAPKPGLAVASA